MADIFSNAELFLWHLTHVYWVEACIVAAIIGVVGFILVTIIWP